MDAYELGEARDVQERAATSAADAVQVLLPAVPINKIWTVLDITYFPSATETRLLVPYIYSRANVQHAIDYAASRACNPATVQLGLIPMGIEVKLYPGERLGVWRDVATAGSTMTMNCRIIETDMPLYSYVEPQIQSRMRRARTEILAGAGGGGVAGPGGPAPRPGSITRPPAV